MQRNVRWLLVAGIILALGCRKGGPPAEDNLAAGNSKGAANAARPQTTDALVQVAVYGLGVLKFERDHQRKLIGLSAHFPEAADHNMKFYQGIYNGKYKWEDVTDAQAKPIDIRGKTIVVKMNGVLGEEKKASIGKYPGNPDEAADVGWVLQADEIDDPTSFDESQASAHILFDSGYLETCALVFPKDPVESVCAVQVLNGKNVDRGVSEVMVMRGLVTKSTSTSPTTVEVDLNGTTVRIPATGGTNTVTWRGTTYDTVINIAVGNVYFNPQRTMNSVHADLHLKSLFKFSGTPLSWNMKSSDCPSDDDCTCQPNKQPACWSYLVDFFRNTPSAYDRPICPLVGWDQ